MDSENGANRRWWRGGKVDGDGVIHDHAIQYKKPHKLVTVRTKIHARTSQIQRYQTLINVITF